MEYQRQISTRFQDLFNTKPLLVRSPGRINLIGEHTDYNQGWVLPAAIDKNIYLGIDRRPDDKICLVSENYNESYETILGSIDNSGMLWPDYILGVVEQFKKDGHQLKGFNLLFGGDIPQGAGLSSSAALECATAFALNELFELGYDSLELARKAQAAENEFVGVKCGLMDQFASVFGKKQHLIKLDCKNLSHDYIPFADSDIKILLFDTQVKHTLASSAYNKRREECEQGVGLLKNHLPLVSSLRDANEKMLLTYVKPINETVYRRCSFVVHEISRLERACSALFENDMKQFGELMFETHQGLKNDYEVSCTELDVLVDLVKDHSAVLGARMMGGGFGGCTINLVKADAVDELSSLVLEKYKTKTGKLASMYSVNIEDGTSLVYDAELANKNPVP